MLRIPHILSTAVLAACAMSLLDSTTHSDASAAAQPPQSSIQQGAVSAMTISDMKPIQSSQPQRWVF